MTDAAHETPELEMQLLTAQDGTAYLLPRALLEAARLTPEELAAVRESVADDDVHQRLGEGPPICRRHRVEARHPWTRHEARGEAAALVGQHRYLTPARLGRPAPLAASPTDHRN